MSTDCRPSAAPPAAPIEVSPPFTKRRIDHIDEPARPLGAKRAALQVRRLRASQPVARAAAKKMGIDAGALTLASKDNNIAFSLRATAVGLLIERTQRQPVGSRLARARRKAPWKSASARAPWNKWKGPARVKRRREGGRLCRERPSRSCERRYGSHKGRPMNAGEANKRTTTACHVKKPATAAKSIKANFITSADRRDVMGRQRPAGPGNYRHKLDTCAPWTKHVLLFSNSAVAAAHPGMP